MVLQVVEVFTSDLICIEFFKNKSYEKSKNNSNDNG